MSSLLPADLWNVEVLALALRTTAQTVDLVKPPGATGVYVTVNWTVEADTVTLTPSIQIQTHGATPVYETLLAATALTAIGVSTYLVALGVGAAAEDVTKVVSYPLPRNWRFKMAVGDTDAATYEVWAQYV